MTLHIQKLEDGSILLTGPVMVPNARDCDYDRGEPPLTKEQIREFAESFENYNFVDSEHEITKTLRTRGEKYQSFILKEDRELELFDGSTQVYPAGTWMMTSHVTDQEAIENGEKGMYTGYSPAVRSRGTADLFLELINAHKLQEAESLKSRSQGGLIKDIPDPVVLAVTLTKKPCLHDSKYCKLKDTGEKMSEDKNTKTKILEALGMSDAADIEALKSEVSSLDEKFEEFKKDNEEALKSMKEEIVSDFKDALKEFADKSSKPEDEEQEESESEEEQSQEEENSEDEEKPNPDNGSKQGSNHNGSDKSQEDEIEDTYEFLGRHPDGTVKRA